MVQAFPVDSNSIAKAQQPKTSPQFAIVREFKETEELPQKETELNQVNKFPDLADDSNDKITPNDDSIREELTLNSSTDNLKTLETSGTGQVLSADQISRTRNYEVFMSGDNDESARKRFSKVRKSSKLDSHLEVFGAFCSTSLPNT